MLVSGRVYTRFVNLEGFPIFNVNKNFGVFVHWPPSLVTCKLGACGSSFKPFHPFQMYVYSIHMQKHIKKMKIWVAAASAITTHSTTTLSQTGDVREKEREDC